MSNLKISKTYNKRNYTYDNAIVSALSDYSTNYSNQLQFIKHHFLNS